MTIYCLWATSQNSFALFLPFSSSSGHQEQGLSDQSGALEAIEGHFISSSWTFSYLFFDFHRFSGGDGGGGGGGGGGSGIGSGRSISWDDPLLTDSSILVFIEKA